MQIFSRARIRPFYAIIWTKQMVPICHCISAYAEYSLYTIYTNNLYNRYTNLYTYTIIMYTQIYRGGEIPQDSWPFSSSFFTLFPCIDIKYYRYSNIKVFMGLWKLAKLDLGYLSSSFSFFLLRFQFPRFLNTF